MREDISLKQGFAMLYIFLTGGIMAIGEGVEVLRDSYISALLTLLIVIPLYFIYYQPFIIHKNKNFFEIIDISYGNFFGSIVNLLYILSVFLVAVVSFSRFTLFIKNVALENTSIYIIGIFMVLICIYATYSGFEVLSRFCEIMFIPIVISLILFTLISIEVFEIINIQPFVESGIKSLSKDIYSLSTTPFAECFALIMLVSQSRKQKDMQKTIILSAIASGVTISIIFLRNLLILGYPAIESLYYPSYLAISLVSLGQFFERQEVAVSIIFLIADIVKITSLSIFLCKIINYKFKKTEYKYFSFAIIPIIFITATLIFNDTLKLFRFLEIYRFFLIIPFYIIPVLTFILCKYSKLT